MRWLAGVAVLVLALVLLGMSREPDLECSGGTTPGGLFDERDPGAATADAAVAGFITEADHYTSESSRDEPDVVTYRTYDEGDRLLFVVEAEHRVPKGWFVGRTTTCLQPPPAPSRGPARLTRGLSVASVSPGGTEATPRPGRGHRHRHVATVGALSTTSAAPGCASPRS